MNKRKISLIIALLLSVCFAYAQSEIDVTVDNHTAYNYECSVQFNQLVTPLPGSDPMVFSVHANSSVTAKYKFDEYDVNLRGLKCYLIPFSPPDAYIAVSSWVGTTVDIAPFVGGSYNEFKFDSYSGQGTYEHLTFLINP